MSVMCANGFHRKQPAAMLLTMPLQGSSAFRRNRPSLLLMTIAPRFFQAHSSWRLLLRGLWIRLRTGFVAGKALDGTSTTTNYSRARSGFSDLVTPHILFRNGSLLLKVLTAS